MSLPQAEAERLQLAGVAQALIERLSSDDKFYQWAPHPKQLRFMLATNRIRAIVGGNRTGKSEATSMVAAERLLGWSPTLTRHFGQPVTFRAPQRVWVVSPDANVSRDVSEEKIYAFLPKEDREKNLIWHSVDRQWTHKKTGSTLGFKSADSGRSKFQGPSRTLVGFDEEVPEDIYKECFARTIDQAGDITFSFTALIAEPWMYKLLYKSNRDVIVIPVGLVDNPHLPASALEDAKAEYKGDEYRIRVLGEFILRIGAPFFPREDIEHQLKRVDALEVQKGAIRVGGLVQRIQRAPVFMDNPDGRLRMLREPQPGHNYAIGGDVSGGGPEGDYSVLQVLDCATFEQVAVWRGRVDPGELGSYEIPALARYYNNALVAIEINSYGLATQFALERTGYGHCYRRMQEDRVSEDGKAMSNVGWSTDMRTKRLACSNLKDWLREKAVLLFDRTTCEELRSFCYLDKDLKSKQYGLGAADGNDDCVMALAIALQAAFQLGAPAGAAAVLQPTVLDAVLEDVQSGLEMLAPVGVEEWDEDDFD